MMISIHTLELPSEILMLIDIARHQSDIQYALI